MVDLSTYSSKGYKHNDSILFNKQTSKFKRLKQRLEN